MKKLLTMLIMLSIVNVTPINCMDNNVTFISSDNHTHSFPQWKIESSRLLHTKQELQIFKEKYSGCHPSPFTLKTICKEKIDLFSDALDTQDFDLHFQSLCPRKQLFLINAAGEQELDSPVLIALLVSSYFKKDIFNIFENLYCEETTAIAHHLQRLVILDNCEHKQCITNEAENYRAHSYLGFDHNRYKLTPDILEKNAHFSAHSLLIPMRISDDAWRVDNQTFNNKNKIIFLITPTETYTTNRHLDEAYSEKNKKKLWSLFCNSDDPEKVLIDTTIIEHTKAIEISCISKDGSYLACSSEGPISELSIRKLAAENGKMLGSDIFLTGHSGSIDTVCFNDPATLIAAGSENGIYIWDTYTHKLLATLDTTEDNSLIRFNPHSNMLVSHSLLDGAITLWDTTNISKITIIKTINLNNRQVDAIEFSSCGKKIIIQINRYALLLDELGEIIMDTVTTNEDHFCAEVHAALTPHSNILCVANSYDKQDESGQRLPLDTVALWDVNTGKCIVTLLENKVFLNGIGVTANGRFIITTDIYSNMIKTELYNDTIDACLNWLHTKPTLLQKYLLLRLHRAHMLNEPVVLHPSSVECRMFESLPITPCDVKKVVEKYFLKR